MIDLYHILWFGIVLSVMASGIILVSLYVNPRLWLQDYPKDIQQKVAPKTKEEKRQSLYWGIPFLVILFAIPFLCAWTSQNQGSFLSLFLNAFGVGMFFNFVDLVIIDYGIFCLLRPKFAVIPGTEGMSGYRDYGHHFRGFLIGSAVSVVASAIIATTIRIVF